MDPRNRGFAKMGGGGSIIYKQKLLPTIFSWKPGSMKSNVTGTGTDDEAVKKNKSG